ncbi:chitin synthase-domain-containing protein [Jimgerdemannia flammicorona]|uniref:chitin synthase n=1 Tax=Jimgerdemannia flammicorona TaxID=994334 RepID=A0A433QMB1_9FUNG|nr:chitin synthase-domain-containing protein [Jimgerdemannia flammicorona]
MSGFYPNLTDPLSSNSTFTQTTPYKATISGFALLAAVECIVFGGLYLYNLSVAARRPEASAPRSPWRWSILLFVLVMRTLFVPFYISFDPYNQYPWWMQSVYRVTFIMVTVWFTLFLVMPTLLMPLCWYYFGLGDKRLGKDHRRTHHRNQSTASKASKMSGLSIRRFVGLDDSGVWRDQKYHVICIVPIYNEEPDLLWKGVSALLNSRFSKRRLELHLSFDNPEVSDLFKDLLLRFRKANGDNKRGDERIHYKQVSETTTQFLFNGAMVYIHRWPHGGKRATQAKTFNFVRENMIAHPDDALIMLIDSDNVIHENAMNNFVVSLNKNPKVQALAGYMTCISGNSWNPMRLFQDAEYTACEINRAFEVIMGSVICLPGGLTLVKYNTLLSVSHIYFGDLPTDTLIDYHRNHLGEDRYLSHLLHQHLPSGSLGFCPSARCKTEPPATFAQFVKQRRRWLLGAVSNDAYMLMDVNLWKKLPILMTYKCFQTAWRSTTICQYLLFFGAVLGFIRITPEQYVLNIPTLAVPFCCAWLGISIIAIRLRRYKVPFIWPLLMVIWPMGQCCIDIYTLFTWSKRTWGGPRTPDQETTEEHDEEITMMDNGNATDAEPMDKWKRSRAAQEIRAILWMPSGMEEQTDGDLRIQVYADEKVYDDEANDQFDASGPYHYQLPKPAYMRQNGGESASSSTSSLNLYSQERPSTDTLGNPAFGNAFGSSATLVAGHNRPPATFAGPARTLSDINLYPQENVSNDNLLYPAQSSSGLSTSRSYSPEDR